MAKPKLVPTLTPTPTLTTDRAQDAMDSLASGLRSKDPLESARRLVHSSLVIDGVDTFDALKASDEHDSAALKVASALAVSRPAVRAVRLALRAASVERTRDLLGIAPAVLATQVGRLNTARAAVVSKIDMIKRAIPR